MAPRCFRPESNQVCEHPLAVSSRTSLGDCGKPATRFKRMGDLRYGYYCEEHGPANGGTALPTWRRIRRWSMAPRDVDWEHR